MVWVSLSLCPPVFNLGHDWQKSYNDAFLWSNFGSTEGMIKTTTLLKFKAFRNVINLSNKEKNIDQQAGNHYKKHVAAEQIRKALCSRLVWISKSLRSAAWHEKPKHKLASVEHNLEYYPKHTQRNSLNNNFALSFKFSSKCLQKTYIYLLMRSPWK